MRRFLFLFHRYLGIAIGLIMVVWCLSGFVMMYAPFPELSNEQRLQGTPPLELDQCCQTSQISGLGLVDVNRFTVEMLADTPVVRFRASGSQNPMVNLRSGEVIERISPERAEAIASTVKRQNGVAGEFVQQQEVRQDQWTVTSYYDYHRPLHFFASDDPAATHWYVSGASGELVQLTTGSERFWSWLGAIPHWLYPTVLRQHTDLWAQVVIWLSVAGVFLTVIGLYVGVSQYKTLGRGRKSPYRGVALWHHYTGLLFGLFILTWVTSGLLSMNPWGLFDLSGGGAERRQLQGVPLHSAEVEDFLERLPQADLPDGTVRIEGYALLGKLYFLAYQADGNYRRYEGRSMGPQPLDESELQRLSSVAAAGVPIAQAELLEREDAYYYRHKGDSELPVYRVILDNDDRTRLYLNTTSGELALHMDRQKRSYRWLFSGLHQLDLSSLVRARPLWDILTWLLLLGVTVGTITGAYMGARRLLR